MTAELLKTLLASWIPALEGVKEKLEAGARVAIVGCGEGTAMIAMAEAYPRSKFYGFDPRPSAIATAAEHARRAGVTERAIFQVAKSVDFPGGSYDLVACIDNFHELENPVESSKHVKRRIAPDGTWMIVEPSSGPCASEARLKDAIVTGAGFSRFHRAAMSALSIVLEVRL